MAIYHLSCQTIGRSSGRSAVAAAAYRAGERLTDERTGAVSDYTRKREVTLTRVVLPEGAPAEYADRATLWNAAERAERGRNAQVAREFDAAIPLELSREQGEALAVEFAESMAREGMCSDVSVHWKPGNPHFHLMCTVRPVGPDGFGQKSTTEYLMRDRDGNERGASASEARELESQGWAKLYVYKTDDGDMQLTKAEAEARGLDPIKARKRKQPVQTTRYLTDWAEVEALERWRERWERMANDALSRAGSTARIDRRSNLERGIDAEPTRHEGAAVRAMEARGIPTELHAENEARRERNAELPALVKERLEAERGTVPQISEEEARADVLALAAAAEVADVPIPARERRSLEEAAEFAALDAMESAARAAASGGDPIAEATEEANRAAREEAARGVARSMAELLARAAEALRSYIARLLLLMQAARREAMERGEVISRQEAAAHAVRREPDTPRPANSAYRARMQADAEDRQLELELSRQRQRQKDRSR